MINALRTSGTLVLCFAVAVAANCFGEQPNEEESGEPASKAELVDEQLPEVLSINENENWPQDFVFRIVATELLPDGRLQVIAKGRYHGTEVGLAVVLSTELEHQDVELEGDGSYLLVWSTLEIRSIGEASDALLRALLETYESVLPNSRFIDAISCDAVYLNDDPAHMGEEMMHIKIFTAQSEGPNYAEAFVNIDLANARLVLAEKDADYRDPLLRSLSDNANK